VVLPISSDTCLQSNAASRGRHSAATALHSTIESLDTGPAAVAASNRPKPEYRRLLRAITATLQAAVRPQSVQLPEHLTHKQVHMNMQEIQLSVASYTSDKFRQIRWVLVFNLQAGAVT